MSRSLGWVVAVVVLGCGGPVATDGGDGFDGGPDAAAATCSSDTGCDDGLFCNGAERCAPDDADADARGCVLGAAPCMPSQVCDDAADECRSECEVEGDADGDGQLSIECGGIDCDDADPQRAPGNLEICDTADRDEDCDPLTYGYRDGDMDGSPDVRCCNVDGEGARHCGDDCDDMRAGVNPDVPEVCNARDDDCDTMVDEDVTARCWADGDADGYAAADAVETAHCVCPAGTTNRDPAGGADCDDAVAFTYPGAAEICDEADNDCDGTPDDGAAERPWYCDDDGDGYGDRSRPSIDSCAEPTGPCARYTPRPDLDCDDDDPANYPGAVCPLPHALGICLSDGTCAFDSCEDGFANCDASGATGCEVPLGTTEACLACGDACEAGEACCASGCASLESDVAACGSCGFSCGARADRCAGGHCWCGTGAPCPPGETCYDGTCQAPCTTTCDPARTDRCDANTCRCGTGGACSGSGTGSVCWEGACCNEACDERSDHCPYSGGLAGYPCRCGTRSPCAEGSVCWNGDCCAASCDGVLADSCNAIGACTCGSAAPCDAARADNCTSGACRCGTGAACSAGQLCINGSCCAGTCGPDADRCDAAGNCVCGSSLCLPGSVCLNGTCCAEECDAGTSDRCASGACRCGSSAPCDPVMTDRCTSGSCRCGTSGACNAVRADACTFGNCTCGSGLECTGNQVDRCTAGECVCGTSQPCDPVRGRCIGESCRCGTGPECAAGQNCFRSEFCCTEICEPDTADRCDGSGACACGTGPACAAGQFCVDGTCCPSTCDFSHIDHCEAGGACACGASGQCDADRASRCNDGACVCGSIAQCPAGRVCFNRGSGYCCTTQCDNRSDRCDTSGNCRCGGGSPCPTGMFCSLGTCS